MEVIFPALDATIRAEELDHEKERTTDGSKETAESLSAPRPEEEETLNEPSIPLALAICGHLRTTPLDSWYTV